MVTVKKFGASWCGPCKALAPVLNELKGQFQGVTFEEFDIDIEKDLAYNTGIYSVPTVIIERNGKEVHRFIGLSSKMTYANAINESLK